MTDAMRQEIREGLGLRIEWLRVNAVQHGYSPDERDAAISAAQAALELMTDDP